EPPRRETPRLPAPDPGAGPAGRAPQAPDADEVQSGRERQQHQRDGLPPPRREKVVQVVGLTAVGEGKKCRMQNDECRIKGRRRGTGAFSGLFYSAFRI